MTVGSTEVTKFEMRLLNDSLRRIKRELDLIQGVSGNFTRGKWTFADDAIKYTDTNGTVLHGHGNV